jgi:recombination protein RecA
MRIDVRRIGQVKKGDEKLGNRTRVRAVKNKLAPPFREVEFDIMWGTGICSAGDLIDLDVIQRNGSWLAFNGENLGQGRESAKARLLELPTLADSVRAMVESAGPLAVMGDIDA